MANARTPTESAQRAEESAAASLAAWEDMDRLNARASHLRQVVAARGHDAGLSVIAEEAVVRVEQEAPPRAVPASPSA